MVLMVFDAEGAAGTNVQMVVEALALLTALMGLIASIQFEALVALRVFYDADGVGFRADGC